MPKQKRSTKDLLTPWDPECTRKGFFDTGPPPALKEGRKRGSVTAVL